MICLLTGTVIRSDGGAVVLDVHGVGYFLTCPLSTPNLTPGVQISLHTYLAVRETALDLYGFQSLAELQVFELLLGVPKIGPKSALHIMNQATPTLLGEAAEKNDPVYLQKISGLGKKTCENIVQHLSDKRELLPTTRHTTDTLSSVQADAIDALIALGYDTNTAREVVLELDNKDATVNSLITAALKRM